MPVSIQKDVEVHVRSEGTKAIIEGKTAVPFQTFVKLVLQRKVFGLFKDWGKEPIILASELLTTLASAEQDSQEDKSNLIFVTLGVGIIAGIFFYSLLLFILAGSGIAFGVREHLLVAGGILALGVLSSALMRVRRKKRGETLTETLEKLTQMVSK